MPMRAHYRSRNLAIGRKGAYETDFLFGEHDSPEPAPHSPKLNADHDAKTALQPNSPVSVASNFDIPVEIKSFVLPGQWIVVGKGGKLVKNEKMYDEAAAMASAKNKKKRRQRSRKVAEPHEPEALVAALAETGSSSKCLHDLHRSTTQRDKQLARSKDAKFWACYQRDKQRKRSALDELVPTLSLAADDGEATDAQAQSQPTARTQPKGFNANSSKDKARRRARAAAIAARCTLWDVDDEPAGAPTLVENETTTEEARPPRSRTRRLSGELELCFGLLAANASPPTQVNLQGAWTTVGKRGKKVSDFPPLQPIDQKVDTVKAKLTTSGSKRRNSTEQGSPQESPKRSNKRERSAGTSIKCSVM